MEKAKKENHCKSKYKTKKKPLIIYSVFALVIIVVCFVFFIFNYKAAYDNDAGAGYISPAFGVRFYHAVIAVISVGVALFVRFIWENDIKLLPLVLISLILPFLCYFSNYYALDEDGTLYSLVDEGGVLRFIVIEDYNFNDIPDRIEDSLDEENTSRSAKAFSQAEYDRHKLSKIECLGKGLGPGIDSTFFTSDIENKQITLLIGRKYAKYENVTLELYFSPEFDSSKISFFLVDGDTQTPIPFEKKTGYVNTFVLTFDGEFCSKVQEKIDPNYSRPTFTVKYQIDE